MTCSSPPRQVESTHANVASSQLTPPPKKNKVRRMSGEVTQVHGHARGLADSIHTFVWLFDFYVVGFAS